MDKLKKFIEKSVKTHGTKYDYSEVNYINSLTKVKIICPEHGAFMQTPQAHVRGNGCPLCSNKVRGRIKRSNTNEFIKKSNNIHKNKYDYSKTQYINANTKVIIICPEHGEFQQTPSAHLNGHGCPKCAGYNLNYEDIIKLFIKTHGLYYDYSKVIYNGMNHKVTIICPEHGEFQQTPSKHIRGQKCPKCSNIEKGLKTRYTTKEFIEKANSIHGNKYDYSKTNYLTAYDKVEIICPKHGVFHQFPYDHLHGHGCPFCSNIFSFGEMEIYNYLINELGEDEVILHDRKTLNGLEIDILIPSKKIGIEYNGLYWHSEKMGKDKWYHFNKMKKCQDYGINLIQIFEDEYINNKSLVINKLRHILKLDRICPKIMGRKCVIKEIDFETAKNFLNKNHIQGYSNTTLSIGAFCQNILIGVMSFTKTKENNNWILNRFATDDKYICQGVGGKLFNFFIKKYKPTHIKSFADRRWTFDENNNLYVKLGFKLTKILNPDYRYIEENNQYKRIHKFNLRKKTLHNHYNLPIDITEKEMTSYLKLYKIWDCGLLKFEWFEKSKSPL